MKINPSVILAILLTYLTLYVTAVLKAPPYTTFIQKPVAAAQSLIYDAFYLKKEKFLPICWGTPRDERMGVVKYDEAASAGGLTFFSTGEGRSAYLVAMDGTIVHQWTLAHRDIWPRPDYVQRIVPDHARVLSRAQLLPDGSVLAVYHGNGSHPLGYGLAKIDKNSQLVWAYSDATHHDVEVDSKTGHIYTLSHRIRTEPYPGMHTTKARPPLYEDFLVILSPDGQRLKKMSFFDLFSHSPYQGVIEQLRRDPVGGDTPAGDMLHPNGIEIITSDVAGKAPMLIEGNILVSFRNNNMLAVIDPKEETVTWATFLPTRFQHDPRLLPDGSVIVFDNEGHTGPGGRSRVVRIDPNTSEILWQYTGTENEPLYSAYHSAVDPLPNGNILITESLNGRLLEITPDGEIVWDYRSPWQETDANGKTKVPAFYRARRFEQKELPFLDRN